MYLFPNITSLIKLISLASPTIVISPDFLPELKKLPDATLSMEAAVDEVRISYASTSVLI